MKLPQLTLRELFLLIVIAAMGCGWWVERQSLGGDAKRLRESADEKDVRIRALESELASYATPSAVYVRDQNGVLHDVTSKP